MKIRESPHALPCARYQIRHVVELGFFQFFGLAPLDSHLSVLCDLTPSTCGNVGLLSRQARSLCRLEGLRVPNERALNAFFQCIYDVKHADIEDTSAQHVGAVLIDILQARSC